MAHPRKIIRHAVAALLTNATAAIDRVKATRVDPNRKTRLPAIGVYTLSEETDPENASTAPRELWRDLKLMIEGMVADSAAVSFDDAMDDLAEQIEAAMDSDRYLSGAAGDCILTSTELAFLPDNGADPIIGVVTLTYSVTYRTSPAVPSDIADLLRVGVTTQIEGAGSDNVASDVFNVRPDP